MPVLVSVLPFGQKECPETLPTERPDIELPDDFTRDPNSTLPDFTLPDFTGTMPIGTLPAGTLATKLVTGTEPMTENGTETITGTEATGTMATGTMETGTTGMRFQLCPLDLSGISYPWSTYNFQPTSSLTSGFS